jgi:hypothetical protein
MRDENGRMLVIWPLGRTNKAIIVAIIRRAAAVNAAIFNPKMIRSAVTPLTKAPNAATPIAPPTCRAALSTAEAVPDLARSTLDNIAVVIAGTASPIPAGMRTKPGSSKFRLPGHAGASRERTRHLVLPGNSAPSRPLQFLGWL